jgi:hypothetical protein
MFFPRSRLAGDGVTCTRIFDTSEALVVLKFGKVTDTLLIYLRNLLAYHGFWSEVSVTSRNKRNIDHYSDVPFRCWLNLRKNMSCPRKWASIVQ